ncbi:MAG: hypothetical protein A2W93_05330 [Bacteroidetes bacterium GWF2_43_63]|nr:MAG: hypothetical protein A2W94_11820 [Bacteroidetes bacterium GWE2_42_42]OFY56296.1 MAG: hypothetical protein A2W93_05330 [Bacteroidetes bacterium GWF2_43_63]HBG71976.1 hypothetical protein [Bacteroidales bacterium]HCB61877.1 hypothetical protein [Bacteroidales bacterium]HCY23899.1 hypothetical protein [Bacteroidales bacterium]
MKSIVSALLLLLLLSSCKKETPDLPPEYEYLKGEWVAYETTAFTTDYHGGYISHTKPVENYDRRVFFKDDCYISSTENIGRKYDISNLIVRESYDTNIIHFETGINFYFHINEDMLEFGGGLLLLFPEIDSEDIEGGRTYYRRVQ